MAHDKEEHHAEHHKEHDHTEHEHHESHHEGKKFHKGKMWMIATAVFAIAFIIFLVLFLTAGRTSPVADANSGSCSITPDANLIGTETVDFLSKNFPVTGIILKNATLERGLVNVTINVQGQDLNIFTSTDGEIVFIPGGAPIYKTEYAKLKAEADANAQAKAASVPKTDKPKVDVFVMSYCPYGTQIEKGLLPVVNLLKDKADIQIKFVNYTLHGEKETIENMNEYCIQQKYPTQYYNYLGCFLEDSNSARCVAKEGFDATVLSACTTKLDSDYNIIANQPQFPIYDAENKAYGVTGSPSTVINGVLIDNMPRSSQGILDKICATFTTKPPECSTALSTETPAAGFGYTAGTGSTSASCS